MRLLQRKQRQERDRADDYHEERPLPDEAPEPQPERAEPTLAEPGPTDLSKRDYVAVVRRAVKKFGQDHMTNIAAALAYYAFLAIPSALMVAVGVFGLVAGPHAVTTLIGKLHGILPGQATSLLEDSLKNMTQHKGTAISVLSIGGEPASRPAAGPAARRTARAPASPRAPAPSASRPLPPPRPRRSLRPSRPRASRPAAAPSPDARPLRRAVSSRARSRSHASLLRLRHAPARAPSAALRGARRSRASAASRPPPARA